MRELEWFQFPSKILDGKQVGEGQMKKTVNEAVDGRVAILELGSE
jgi:hypothetical protein